jgi:hypothetical protein
MVFSRLGVRPTPALTAVIQRAYTGNARRSSPSGPQPKEAMSRSESPPLEGTLSMAVRTCRASPRYLGHSKASHSARAIVFHRMVRLGRGAQRVSNRVPIPAGTLARSSRNCPAFEVIMFRNPRFVLGSAATASAGESINLVLEMGKVSCPCAIVGAMAT